ncbi:MAG: PQQ-binding-like beta-propeller repeat protein, partial [Anaerolineales bacterium]|nr:PQQ-binding-like beta-propeller repeat protein [Anaerolineales bacterium]MDW8446322.1 PQQ-binding-like beta-propeller repeat protein [Anaerolineales bacterium]
MKGKLNLPLQALVMLAIAFLLAGVITQGFLFAQTIDRAVYLPLILKSDRTPAATDWYQHAADAQRTSYMPQSILIPWRWKWAWNGPDNRGGIVSGKFGLPRNSQPVVGGGRVYLAAGSRGVYALNNANGSVVWKRSNIGAVNSTPAYDPDTGAL